MTEGWGGATAVFPKPAPGRRSPVTVRLHPVLPRGEQGPGKAASSPWELPDVRVAPGLLQTPPRWGPRHVPPDSLGGTICRAQTENVNYTTMQMFDSVESSDGWGGSPLHRAVLADKMGRRPFPESRQHLHESGWL